MMRKAMGRSKRPLGFGTKKLRDSQWQQVVERNRKRARTELERNQRGSEA